MDTDDRPRWPTPDVGTLRRIVVVGIVARFVLWIVSAGASDMRGTVKLAGFVAEHGLRWTYEHRRGWSGSPVSGLWSGLAQDLATWLEAPFELVYKAPAVFADIVTMALIWRLVSRRSGRVDDGWRAAAVLAGAPALMWVSAHHGGLESVVICLAMAAVVLVDEGDRPLLAGAALGAAMSVHLQAAILLPILFAIQARTLRSALGFAVGVVVAASPWVLPLSIRGIDLIEATLATSRAGNRFGLDLLLEVPILGQLHAEAAGVLRPWVMVLVLLSSLALGLRARRTGRGPVEVAALIVAIAIVAIPDLPLPAAALPIPFLVAASLRHGLVYAMVASAFLTGAYIGCTEAEVPLSSMLSRSPGAATLGLGLVGWLLLCAFIAARLGRAWRRSASNISPAALPTWTVAVALPFGVALAVATPPFQVADEPLHAFIGCNLARGVLTPGFDDPPPFTATMNVPAGLLALHRDTKTLNLPFNPERRAPLTDLVRLAAQPHVPGFVRINLREETGELASYPPAMYVPQAVACRVAVSSMWRPQQVLLAMRLANLFAFLVISWWALRLLGTGREAVALLLVSPMSLSLAASASGDGQLIPLVALWLAVIQRACVAPPERPPLTPLAIAGCALLAFMLSLAKAVYAPLALAFLLIPAARFRSPLARVGAVVVVVVVAAIGAVAWMPFSGGSLEAFALSKGIDPTATLEARLDKPFTFFVAAVRTLVRERILTGVVGTLGWRDVVLPFSTVAVFWALLLPLTLLGARRPLQPLRSAAFVLLGLVALAGLLLFYALYFTKPEGGWVVGVQGRHVIPVLVFVVVGLGGFIGLVPSVPPGWERRLHAVFATVVAGLLVSALGAVEARYYVSPDDVAPAIKAQVARPEKPGRRTKKAPRTKAPTPPTTTPATGSSLPDP